MAKPPTAGIQSLPAIIDASGGTTGDRTAVAIQSHYTTALRRDFLCKKIRVHVRAGPFSQEEQALIGFARGDMTVAEIAAALTTQLPDPEDFQLWDDFVNASGIFWETLHLVTMQTEGAAGSAFTFAWNEVISFGGGGGIPLEAGHGIVMFAFNPVADSWATPTFNGEVVYVGIFLKDSR